MQNWSKQIQWQPGEVVFPESESAVQALVQKALKLNKKIRIIGSAHSFNPLWVTNDILVSLDRYQGLVAVDKENHRAIVKAGTKLYTLGELLYKQGLAMENLGDIDRQSIAGTISTGTHGTGLGFGTISTQVISLRFVNGLGKIISCSETKNHELFKAAQISLGALGIITEITLQCVPAYKLELISKKEVLQEVLDSFQSRIESNRNVEFYWFPHTQNAWTKSSNIADSEPDKIGLMNYLTEYVLENYAFKVLCEAARWFPVLNKQVSKISAASIPNVRKVYPSHKVYATPRLVRFNEMEYSIPLETHIDVLKEVIKTVNKKKFKVHFPIENRVVKKDDIFLSPAYGRDSAYIACHVYSKKDYKPFFKAMEDIFLAHDGRPHWGKIHTLKANKIAIRYPKFGIFKKFREEQDPQNLFLNDYLKGLFEIDADQP